jgi:hypothetical protein
MFGIFFSEHARLRQICASLFNRTNFAKEITTVDIIITRILNLDFGPFTQEQLSTFSTEFFTYKYDLLLTIISLGIFFGFLFWRLKNDVMFSEMIMKHLLHMKCSWICWLRSSF